MHSYTLARDIRKVHFWWTPPLFMDVETAEALLAAARNIGLTPVEVDDGFSSTGKSVLISHQKF